MKAKKPRTEDALPICQVLDYDIPLNAVNIENEEVRGWKNMSLEEATKASVKASTQLLIHSLDAMNKLAFERARLEKAEAEGSSLAQKVKDLEKQLQTSEAQTEASKKDVIEKQKMLAKTNEERDALKDELEEQRARTLHLEEQERSDFPEERQRIDDAGFEKGFNFYLLNFNARDPEYTWEKWGAAAMVEMAKLKEDTAEAIKASRVDLGLEDEPSGWEEEASPSATNHEASKQENAQPSSPPVITSPAVEK